MPVGSTGRAVLRVLAIRRGQMTPVSTAARFSARSGRRQGRGGVTGGRRMNRKYEVQPFCLAGYAAKQFSRRSEIRQSCWTCHIRE